MPPDNAVIESQNVKTFEDPMMVEVMKFETDTVEYDHIDPDVVFDDGVGNHVGNGAATDEAENGSDDIDQVEIRTKQDIDGRVDLEALTCNPGLRRSKRRTNGQNPHSFGFDTACVAIDGMDSLPQS